MTRLFSALLIVAALSGCHAAGPKSESCCDPDPGHIGHLRHVVFFKFKADTTPTKLKEIEAAFAELPKKIDAIIDFEWGTDVGVENLSQGYTHCFLVTFKDAKGRDAYLPHPAHKAFVDLAKPQIEAVHVIDYVAKK